MERSEERLLVVDDVPENREILVRRLRRKGYQVEEAPGGREALERLAGEPFDLVLLDIMMPEVDGIEVLTEVRRQRDRTALPVIMATAKDGSEDIVQALELGANDYVTKPLDFPVVLARVQTQLALRRASRELAAAHARMKKDLDAAGRIQRSLIPTAAPDVAGATFAFRFQPCDELAGDCLDVVPLGHGLSAAYLVDVSGHGVASALLSVTLHRVLSRTGEGTLLLDTDVGGAGTPVSPAEVTTRLNRRFPMDLETRQYFTFAYGLLDAPAGRLHFTAAGHPGPVVVPRGGRAVQHSSTGPAVGWFPQARFRETVLELGPGDRVYFFSDGIPESADPSEEELGPERLMAALEEGATLDLEGSLDHLLEVAGRWRGEAPVADDISVLAIELET